MKRAWFLLVLLIFTMTLAAALPVIAQDENNTIVDGLTNPRNLYYDADGNLWIAEAGNGGPLLTLDEDPFGNNSQITMVAPDGTVSVPVIGLTSFREGNTLGVHAVHVTDDSIWILLGETSDFRIPFSHALIELDRETNRVLTWVDLLALELNEDPDDNPNQQSNAVDFDIAPDGTFYIANAGCNCVMSWSEDAGLAVAMAWPYISDNPVPTSVEIDADGNIYVAFLTGFPFPAEGSRIEVWNSGELIQTYDGLTTVTGLELTDDGRIIAVETGLEDGIGRVVEVTMDGLNVLADNLPVPYGVVQTPEGDLAVSIGAIGGQGGSVIRVPLPM